MASFATTEGIFSAEDVELVTIIGNRIKSRVWTTLHFTSEGSGIERIPLLKISIVFDIPIFKIVV